MNEAPVNQEAVAVEAKLCIGGVEAGAYRVVYAAHPAGLDVAAKKLCEVVAERFGVVLDCVRDVDADAVAHEILIGRTNREASGRSYTESPALLMSYRCAVEDGKLLLICGGAFSALSCVEALAQVLAASEDVALAGTVLETTDLLTLDRQERTEGSTLRVMTTNLLADRWVTKRHVYPAVSQRAEMYVAMLSVYRPDLIGVQETDAPWLEHLPYYLDTLNSLYGLDYTWILNQWGDQAILTSIIYDKSRFVPVNCGSEEYAYVPEQVSARYKLRMLTWAVLRDTNDGKLYALVNTHSGGSNDVVLGYEIPTALSKFAELRAKYEGLTIFATGDFNNHGGTWYDTYKAVTHLIDSREAAESNGTLVNLLPGIPEGIYIDHAFTNLPASAVVRWETVDKNFAERLSDHRFQYGDYLIP